MLQIKPKNKLQANNQNLVVLGFDAFNYLDVEDNEELSKKDLHLFLEYKITREFSLDEDMYDFFYIQNSSKTYQVYSIEKDLFSTHKDKILIPKSLAYSSFGGNYYVLLIEEKISRLMLYIDGAFVLSNHIAFSSNDIDNDSKMEELLVFLNGIISHISKDKIQAKQIDTMYMQITTSNNQFKSIDTSTIQDSLSLRTILPIKETNFYQYIKVDLFDGRMFYNVYPMISSYIVVVFVLIIATFIGYMGLYFNHSSIQDDTKKLQQFYNHTSKDIKKYYILQKELIDANDTLSEQNQHLSSLANHSRAFDITSVLVNALVDIKKYKVYLQSFEMKGDGRDRWVYVDVLFEDKEILQRYIQSSPDYIVESIGKDKDMFTYRVKAKIK